MKRITCVTPVFNSDSLLSWSYLQVKEEYTAVMVTVGIHCGIVIDVVNELPIKKLVFQPPKRKQNNEPKYCIEILH